MTGKDPTNWGKLGTKRHIIVGRYGLPLVMTGLSHRLMMTPKARPGQRVSGGDHLVPEQLPDHAKDLGHGVGNHPTANPLSTARSR